MNQIVAILCDFREPPTTHECQEAVWSQGRSCKKCDHPTCYRRGWSKAQADADNRRLVSANIHGSFAAPREVR